MQRFISIRYFMLPILLWGCAGRDMPREGTAPSQVIVDGTTLALFILVPLFLLLGVLFVVCWMVLVRQRKALLLAEVNLHQQEVRSAALVFQLREASRRYKALQQKADVSRGRHHSGGAFPEEGEDIPEI